MKVKFRKKGEVIQIDISDALTKSFPEDLQPEKGGPEGLDLTEYSVVHVTAGRNGKKKAQKVANRISDVIVLYQYEWHNGFGAGVILPDNFNPQRVKFFETEEQLQREARDYREEKAKEVCQEIRENIPGVRVRNPRVRKQAARITPMQEVYSNSDRWCVFANSLEEAKKGVEEKRPFWREWNQRILNFLQELRVEDYGIGSIPISFRSDKVAVGLPETDDNWRRRYLKLEKVEGKWQKAGVQKAENTNSLFSYWNKPR